MPLGVEAHLTDETWDELLLNKSSVLFKTLEAKIEDNVSSIVKNDVKRLTLNKQ